MPQAEYDVARPRSNITTSRSGRRFLACDAALPPAASPPITTRRCPTMRTLERRAPGAHAEHGQHPRAEALDELGQLRGAGPQLGDGELGRGPGGPGDDVGD